MSLVRSELAQNLLRARKHRAAGQAHREEGRRGALDAGQVPCASPTARSVLTIYPKSQRFVVVVLAKRDSGAFMPEPATLG